ncbi:HAD family hydrolase [Corynebacterium confusum]|uniref:HAD family hydrolase n=1 Tax=Corynebacterium sp. HMSC04H06 TaxID=1581050 RepID=UPI00143C8497|nr:HAD family phosphatase [Corynebacterium sp. HMSC04H06]
MQQSEVCRRTEAVLFDFNGTLSDDETILERSYAQALENAELAPLGPGEYAACLGKSEPEIARDILTPRHATDRYTEFLAAVGAAYAQLSWRAGCIDKQTVEFVRSLKGQGYPLGIVTGTLRQMIMPAVRDNGLEDHLDVIVTIEDVAHGKPAPDGYLQAAAVLGVEPGAVLAFEDSRAGVESARSAGMSVVGIGPNTGESSALVARFPDMRSAAASLMRVLRK